MRQAALPLGATADREDSPILDCYGGSIRGRIDFTNPASPGVLPARLAIIVPNLREFDLGGNRLTGCIPEDFKKAPPVSPGRSGIERLGLPFCGAGGQAGGARATPTPGSRATAWQNSSSPTTAVSGSTRVPSTVAPAPTASPAPETRAGPVSRRPRLRSCGQPISGRPTETTTLTATV